MKKSIIFCAILSLIYVSGCIIHDDQPQQRPIIIDEHHHHDHEIIVEPVRPRVDLDIDIHPEHHPHH